jgi:hypothetical protein
LSAAMREHRPERGKRLYRKGDTGA